MLIRVRRHGVWLVLFTAWPAVIFHFALEWRSPLAREPVPIAPSPQARGRSRSPQSPGLVQRLCHRVRPCGCLFDDIALLFASTCNREGTTAVFGNDHGAEETEPEPSPSERFRSRWRGLSRRKKINATATAFIDASLSPMLSASARVVNGATINDRKESTVLLSVNLPPPAPAEVDADDGSDPLEPLTADPPPPRLRSSPPSPQVFVSHEQARERRSICCRLTSWSFGRLYVISVGNWQILLNFVECRTCRPPKWFIVSRFTSLTTCSW